MTPGRACSGRGGSCRDGLGLVRGWPLWGLRARHSGHSSQRDVAAQGLGMGKVLLGRSLTLGKACQASVSFL